MLMVNQLVGFGAGRSLDAVTASFVDVTRDNSNASPYTFPGVNFGVYDSSRLIVVAALLVTDSGGAVCSAMTIGGTPATIITQAGASASGSASAALGYAAPAGTSGDVVVSYTGNVYRCKIVLYQLRNVISAAPYSSNSAGGSVAQTCTLNVPADGVVIGCAANWHGSGASFSTTFLTTDLNQSGEGADEQYYAGSKASASDLSSQNVVFTPTNVGSLAAICAAWR